jgi:hypothetical protein
VNLLEAGFASAVRAAQNPGEAPRTSGLPIGVAGASDLTDDERQLLAGAVVAIAAVRSGQEHQTAAAKQDPSQVQFFRARGGSTVVALPGARRTS